MATILLVDDNEMNADMLSRRLIRRGFTVVVVGDGADGVAQALFQSPDLILMDMQLPVINGWEAVRLIRRSPGLSRLPIIGLSANSDADQRDAMLEAGCDEVEGKPVELPRLLAKIDLLLGRAAIGEGLKL